MTIVVRRDKTYFARLSRFRLRLDGVPVGRIAAGRVVELTGSGFPQRLTASIDGSSSNELLVTDPGPNAVTEVFLTSRGQLLSTLRVILAPGTALVLVPAGQPIPAPPPFRVSWPRLGLIWLTVTLVQSVPLAVTRARRESMSAADLTVPALVFGLVFALLLGAAVLLLRRSNRTPS